MAIQLQKLYQGSVSRFHLSLKGGQNGMKNVISWVYMLEDSFIVSRFHGSELAVTTAMRFQEEGWLLNLVKELHNHRAAGLIVNVGMYLTDIPREVVEYCNQFDFPILTVPWKVFITEMVQDFCMQIVAEQEESRMHDQAIRDAIQKRENQEEYRDTLARFYNLDGTFQIIMLYVRQLEEENQNKASLTYWLETRLRREKEGIHGCRMGLVTYDNYELVILNNAPPELAKRVQKVILEVYAGYVKTGQISIGVGITVNGLEEISKSYHRAVPALRMAVYRKRPIISFEQMGFYKLLFSVEDTEILFSYADEILQVLDNYDQKHGSDYVGLLDEYIKSDRSLLLTAEKTFLHRNTVNYRIQKMKELLGNDLKTNDDLFPLEVALRIRELQRGGEIK